MKKVILDTNFILTCIKQKIDFFEELNFMGLKVIIPEQVWDELESLSSSQKINYAENAQTALRLLEKTDYEEVVLEDKYVDKALIDYSEKNPEVIIATLDEGVKNTIKNNKLIIRNRNRLEVV